jgi:hypothetical protein
LHCFCIAQAVTKSKLKSVIVVDFSGPGDKLTELDRTLADRFSTALAKSNGKFSVAERTQCKPAKGPDGNPSAVRQTIEVTFHLYR